MLAQFSIWPLDHPHLSEDIADVIQVLDQLGVRYEVGAMGTTIEGDWDEVMSAIKICHDALCAAHVRVLTTITIDEDLTMLKDGSSDGQEMEMATAQGPEEAQRQEAVK